MRIMLSDTSYGLGLALLELFVRSGGPYDAPPRRGVSRRLELQKFGYRI